MESKDQRGRLEHVCHLHFSSLLIAFESASKDIGFASYQLILRTFDIFQNFISQHDFLVCFGSCHWHAV